MRVSSNKLLQKYEHPPSHDVVTLLSAHNLSDSNFPEAAHPPEAREGVLLIVATGSIVVQWCLSLLAMWAVCELMHVRHGDSIIADHSGSISLMSSLSRDD